MSEQPTTCAHCQQPLEALARVRGVDICGAAACRQRNAQLRTLQLQQAAADAAIHDAVQAHPGWRAHPPVAVWLQAHKPELTPTTAAQRTTHRAELEAAAASQLVMDRVHRGADARRQADADAAALQQAAPQSDRLCAQCSGRCCVHGAAEHAFIDWRMLQRVLHDTPGANLSDVIQRYVDLLPDAHVEHSCLYHSPQGCGLPRALRSDTCNDYACDALQTLRQVGGQQPPRAVVALTLERETVAQTLLIAPPAAPPAAAPAMPAVLIRR